MANRKLPMRGAQMAETPIQIAIARRMLIEATPKYPVGELSEPKRYAESLYFWLIWLTRQPR